MKKLSVSLFSCLAIVFAITSAFTSISKKTFFDQFRVLKVVPTDFDPSDYNNLSSQSDKETLAGDVLAAEAIPGDQLYTSGSTRVSASDYFEANGPAAEENQTMDCDPNSDSICLVDIITDGINDPYVADFVPGEFVD